MRGGSFGPSGDHKAYMTQSVPRENPPSHDHRYIFVNESLRTIYGTSPGTTARVSGTRRCVAVEYFRSTSNLPRTGRRRRGSKRCKYGTWGRRKLYVSLVIRRCRDTPVRRSDGAFL